MQRFYIFLCYRICGGDVASNTNFCGLCGAPIDHKEDSTEKVTTPPASAFDVSKLIKST